MALRYKNNRRKNDLMALVNDMPPSWSFVTMPLNPQSATALRTKGHWPESRKALK
jgi:hypothetical protein